jgi:hypothetical protein
VNDNVSCIMGNMHDHGLVSPSSAGPPILARLCNRQASQMPSEASSAGGQNAQLRGHHAYLAGMEVDGIVGRIDGECWREVLAWLN